MVRKRLNENEKKGTNLQKKLAKALATGKKLIFHGSTTYTKEMDFSNRLRRNEKVLPAQLQEQLSALVPSFAFHKE